MSRRTLEFLLLLAACPPVFLLYSMLMMSLHSQVSLNMLIVPIGLAGSFLIAHLALRFFTPGADPALLPLVFVIAGIGITFVTRLAPDLATRQVLWLLLGVGAMIATLALVQNLENLTKYKYTVVGVGLVLLLLPILIGVSRGGSKLWLSFGGISIQPGELAKVCICLFLAFFLAENRERMSIISHNIFGVKIPHIRMLFPLILMWALSLVIVIFERDLGSAVLFYSIFLIMLFTATGRWSYIVIGAIMLAVGGVGAHHFFSHVQVRFSIWLDPFQDPSGMGLQIVQSLYSLADGGLFGMGIGKGMATLIPVVESDFIFSSMAEELGLLGGAGVLLLFMLFAIRGFATAARAKSDAAAFVAVGLTSAISLQAFLIVGGVTRLIPLTGVTLPFMSQGGSSLVASFIIVALLLRCGDAATGRSVEMSGSGVHAKLALAGKQAIKAATGNKPTVNSDEFDEGAIDELSRIERSNFISRFKMFTPESGVLGRVALGKRLTILVGTFTLLFAILIANLGYVQIIQAHDLQQMPNNNHTIEQAASIKRGSISTSDGVILARSVEQDGVYARQYPEGKLAAHVVGYISQRYGTTGIESTQNETLTGHKDYTNWKNALDSLAGKALPGNDVVLTINSKIQRAAEEALGNERGAVVVINPKTGAILSMASSPAFDANELQSYMSSSEDRTSGPLYDRATQALYAPGSSFKVVTLAGYLENKLGTTADEIHSPATIEIGGGDINTFDKNDYGTITLREALAYSSNTAFAQLGDKMGASALVETSTKFGVGSDLGADFRLVPSVMPNPKEMTKWETAWAACGQPVGKHDSPAGPQVTAVQNAEIAAAIANHGVAMRPFVIEKILAPDGAQVTQTNPSSLGTACSASTAKQVTDAMVYTVTHGSASHAQVGSISIAGKTGTAEVGGSNTNAWFIGFGPSADATVAIAVVIEDGQSRYHIASQIAGQILHVALAEQGVTP